MENYYTIQAKIYGHVKAQNLTAAKAKFADQLSAVLDSEDCLGGGYSISSPVHVADPLDLMGEAKNE